MNQLQHKERVRSACDGIRRLFVQRQISLNDKEDLLREKGNEYRRLADKKLKEKDFEKARRYQPELARLVREQKQLESDILRLRQALIDYSHDYRMKECEIVLGPLKRF